MVWVPSLTRSPWVPFEPGRPINPLRETQKRKLKKPKPPTTKPNELCTHGDTTSVPQSCHWCPSGIFSPAGTTLAQSWGMHEPSQGYSRPPSSLPNVRPQNAPSTLSSRKPVLSWAPSTFRNSSSARKLPGGSAPNRAPREECAGRTGASLLESQGECSGEQQPGSFLELWPLGMSMNTHEPTSGGM